jgi:hypothetical protein
MTACVCWLAAGPARACGPFFPNWLLVQADQSVLQAPQAKFSCELRRMNLIPSDLKARPTGEHLRQTLETELADLREALAGAGATPTERDDIVQRYQRERLKIDLFRHALEAPDASPDSSASFLKEQPHLRPGTNAPWSKGAVPQIISGLPAEFADYFRGSIAWHQDDLNMARKAWNGLLDRPLAERRYRSTWAMFMLGRSWEDSDRSRAIKCFRALRNLATNGCLDSLGLASASLGYEARLHWREARYVEAIDLYLEQAASGEPDAWGSLAFCASEAMVKPPSVLRTMAAHPHAQRVITAYVISGGWRLGEVDLDSALKEAAIGLAAKAAGKWTFLPVPGPTWHTRRQPVLMWLEAGEAAKVNDVDAAEQIALAAYQAGQMEVAKRWLDRARPTPATQWLKAKLLLRDGNLADAAVLLVRVSKLFPMEKSSTNAPAASGLAGSLFIANDEFTPILPAEQAQG